MTPQDIAKCLSKADLPSVISWAQDWTRTASYADIQDLVAQCPEPSRRHLTALLRDVLAGWPKITHGIPVLLQYDDPLGAWLTLPTAEYAPDPDVTSMSWLPLSILRQPVPFRSAGDEVSIPPGGLSVAVMLITTATPSPPEISGAWWSDLFGLPDGASLRISAKPILPYPETMEAAVMLRAVAMLGKPSSDTPRMFLTDSAFAQVLDTGLEWRRATAAPRIG